MIQEVVMMKSDVKPTSKFIVHTCTALSGPRAVYTLYSVTCTLHTIDYRATYVYTLV